MRPSSPFRHGFLILDKPVGISSAQAVAHVKRALKCDKIGHGGTLDPLASGILPLALGEATKAFNYVVSTRKQYRFTLTFGEERDTHDAEGATTATTGTIPSREDILRVLPGFTGCIMQSPPLYSAIKLNGRRAYDMARAGEKADIPPRPVEIHALELLEADFASSTPSATFLATCGKGTYIRSLARDIALKCNSLGYVSLLRRTAVGKFHEKDAISLDNLGKLVHNAALPKAWVPIELALDDIPAIDLSPGQAHDFRYGRAVVTRASNGEYKALFEGRMVALAQAEDGMLKVLRLFNT